MSSQPLTLITVAEYLERERASDERHEYLNGEIFVMPGGTPAHSLIAMNIGSELRNRLADTPFTVRGSDMRLRTGPEGLYSYADVVVSAAPEEKFESDTLLNPVLIVEVLSKSTANYDRGDKFQLYRTIPSFTEYLIVAQDRIYVEHHLRSSEQIWTMREYTDSQDAIQLALSSLNVRLADIYAKVQL